MTKKLLIWPVQFLVVSRFYSVFSEKAPFCALADPKNLKGGRLMWGATSLFIANARNDLYAFYAEKAAFKNNSEAIGGGLPSAPFESATDSLWVQGNLQSRKIRDWRPWCLSVQMEFNTQEMGLESARRRPVNVEISLFESRACKFGRLCRAICLTKVRRVRYAAAAARLIWRKYERTDLHTMATFIGEAINPA